MPADLHSPEIRVVNPLDDPAWDAKLAELPEASFFHSAPWTRVLQSTYGYTPQYFVAQNAEHLRGILPCLEVSSWLTGRRGVGLPFTDEAGPLGEEAVRMELFAAAKARARQRAWKYLECRGQGPWSGGAPDSTRFLNHQLALTGGEEALFAALDSASRRAIRKAEQSEVIVKFSQSFEDVRHFHRLLCLTRQRHGVPPQPFSFFAQIHRHVLAPGHGWVVLAFHQGQPVAGAVFFHFGQSAIYKFGASNLTFQHLRANNLVMWQAIRRYAGEGFTQLDFGRTSLTNEGLRRFKLSWGAKERTVAYVRYEPTTDRYLVARDESSGWYNRFIRSLPLFTSRLIGSMLYKHLA